MDWQDVLERAALPLKKQVHSLGKLLDLAVHLYAMWSSNPECFCPVQAGTQLVSFFGSFRNGNSCPCPGYILFG